MVISETVIIRSRAHYNGLKDMGSNFQVFSSLKAHKWTISQLFSLKIISF